MKIAISPCPNDTFIFHAWIHRLIPGAPNVEVTYADIDITNHLSTYEDGPDLLKISCAALPWISDAYRLLPCGGALGKGCGPLLLSRGGLEDVASLKKFRVAVPSERSTAYLLFRLWLEEQVPDGVKEIVLMPFHEIMPHVRDGLVDAGLVIHEARFTYPLYDLSLIVDLGNWWESVTDLPIPLGAIVARRSLDLEQIADWIRCSIDHAWTYPETSESFVLSHAKELSKEVVQAHIQLYVNEYSRDLGDKGFKAVNELLQRACEAGLVPGSTVDLININ